MAHRQHVALRTVRKAVGLALFAALVASCKDAPPPTVWGRGQVIDQDTEKPIAGVIVVGKYRGSRGFEGASSCNRVESAVSDETAGLRCHWISRLDLCTWRVTTKNIATVIRFEVPSVTWTVIRTSAMFGCKGVTTTTKWFPS
jgi:hypothetical protein